MANINWVPYNIQRRENADCFSNLGDFVGINHRETTSKFCYVISDSLRNLKNLLSCQSVVPFHRAQGMTRPRYHYCLTVSPTKTIEIDAWRA